MTNLYNRIQAAASNAWPHSATASLPCHDAAGARPAPSHRAQVHSERELLGALCASAAVAGVPDELSYAGIFWPGNRRS